MSDQVSYPPEVLEPALAAAAAGNDTAVNGSAPGTMDGPPPPPMRPPCSMQVPTAQMLVSHLPPAGIVLLCIGCVLSTLTLAIFFEEVNYTLKHFKANHKRKIKTIMILAAYPVFSLTALLAYIIPRASLLADLVANVFFSMCIYEFMKLTIDYLGGPELMWVKMRGGKVTLQSPPLACCCPCCPELPFVPPVFKKLNAVVLQVAIIRPILYFFAAVLWANGSYVPGLMFPSSAYFWVTIINLISTLLAVYGLVIMTRATTPVLAKFRVVPKFLNYPLILICTIVPGIIINIMVMQGAISCNPLLPSKARGDRIYHAFLVLIMFPFSLFGRRLYRRAQEAHMDADHYPGQDPVDGEGSPAQDPEKAALAADENQNANAFPESLPDPEVVKEDTPMTFKIEDYITARASDM